MPEDANDVKQVSDNQEPVTNDAINLTEEQSQTVAVEAKVMQQDASKLPLAEAPVVMPPAKKKKSYLNLIIAAVIFVLLVATALWLTVLKKDDASTNTAKAAQEQALIKRFGVTTGLVEGTAEYSTDKGKTWQKLTVDTSLSEGNQVKTSTDGRVVLLIDDGSAVRLSNSSSLELTSLDVTSIVITNIGGETYSRVVSAATRKYQVVAGDQTYIAKGTAFRTFNNSAKKGVEVFHSTVGMKDNSIDVTEGNSFFALNEQKEKENKVTAIDLVTLKKDDFMKWNSEQDKKSAEFSSALGVLADIDKPESVVVPTPAPVTTQKTGITLSGSVSEYSANFSWKVSGVDTSKGYKLVKSKTSQTPTYPNDSAAYIEAGKTSYSLYLGDGKTYYFRICAYRGDKCDSYSNVVTITTPAKPKEQIVSGAVTLAIAGDKATWTFAGTAPDGFKLVVGTSTAPTYPALFNKFAEGVTTTLPDGLTAGTTYYARVCKYDNNNGLCVDYSNEIQFTAP